MTHWARCHLTVHFPDAILRDGRFFYKFRAYELFSTLLSGTGHYCLCTCAGCVAGAGSRRRADGFGAP